METVYISIGSNLGDREKNCRHAIQELSEFVKVTAVSSMYETQPVGNEDQPLFINCAIEIETDLTPHELLDNLHTVENELGRVRVTKWAPRTIDLDIIFYGNEVLNDQDLTIPHPEAHKRRFVMGPLTEIAPGMIHPLLKLSAMALLNNLNDPHMVIKLDDTSTSDPH